MDLNTFYGDLPSEFSLTLEGPRTALRIDY